MKTVTEYVNDIKYMYTRPSAYIILAIALAFVIGIALFFTLRKMRSDESLQRQELRLEQANAMIFSDALAYSDAELMRIASTPKLIEFVLRPTQANRAHVVDVLSHFLLFKGRHFAAFITSREGEILAHTETGDCFTFEKHNIEGDPIFESVKESRTPSLYLSGETPLCSQFSMYAFAPIIVREAIVGYVTFVMPVEAIELALKEIDDRILIVSPEGFVFASSVPEWSGRFLGENAALAKERQALVDSKRFGGEPILTIPAHFFGSKVLIERRRYRVSSTDFAPQSLPGWKTYSFERGSFYGRPIGFQYAITMVAFALLYVLFCLTLFALYMTMRVRLQGKTLERQSEEVNKLYTELSGFSLAAAHTLREPLRTTKSYVELFSARYTDAIDNGGRELLGYVERGIRRMTELVSDILVYSRILRSDTIENVDLNRAVASALSNLEVYIDEANASVNLQSLPVVHGDETQIVQLFQILLDNAIKFRAPERRLRVEVTLELLGGEWVVGVIDNGIGIAEEFFDDIFVIFRKLHSRDEYAGSGAGLAIARKIALLHGGRIWVTSDGETGSQFYVAFPKA